MTSGLSKKKQLRIFRELLKNPSTFYGGENRNIIDMLDHIFDLRNRPSEDSRFEDAFEDAVQHLVNNDDWELDYTLLTRFDVTTEDNLFKMIKYLIRPDFQSSEQRRLELVDDINSSINQEGFTLLTYEFNDKDQPIFTLSEYDSNTNYPAGVIKNNIKFFPNYVIEDLNYFVSSERNIFILDFKRFSWWNDYSLQSRCNLVYRDSNGKLKILGELKIITNNSGNYSDSKDEDDNYQNFHTILPGKFTELDFSFCSLGQTKEYYQNIKESYQSKFRSILYALRDAAFFPDIAYLFKTELYFTDSLIRLDRAERILREIRLEIYGRSRADMYKFTYLFKADFSGAGVPPISVNFNFSDASEIPNRICAIIANFPIKMQGIPVHKFNFIRPIE